MCDPWTAERVEAEREAFDRAVTEELARWLDRILAEACPRCLAAPQAPCRNLSDRRWGRPERDVQPHAQRRDLASPPPGWITCG